MAKLRLAGRVLHMLLWLTVAVATLLLALTALNWANGSTTLTPDHRGTAVVQSCEPDVGPISWRGFGYYWQCTARVAWDAGDRSTERSRNNQLTPADIGREVRVIEHTAGRPIRYMGVLTEPASGARQFFGMTIAIALFFAMVLPAVVGLTRLLPKAERDRIGHEVAAKRRAEREAQGDARAADEPGG